MDTLERPRTPADELAADRAVARGRAGRDRLPSRLRAEFDAVLDAFEHYESGDDEAARTKLAVISLTSPFLEWKMALRGLIAYVAGDPGRALDNWIRLSPSRLTARLIAPLRAAVDSGFLADKPAALKRALQTAGNDLNGDLWRRLRALQAQLARPDQLPAALALAAETLPQLRLDAPHLIPVLARCCYAAAMTGHPDGARLLRRLFDPPADDPRWSRLQALAAERRGEWTAANRHWERYLGDLESVVGHPDRGRAQALIWLHCAENARRAARRPSATLNVELHLRKALAADPDNVEAHQQLFEIYCAAGRDAKAVAIGQRLAALDPADAECAVTLAELYFELGELDSSIEQYERACTLDPFDDRLAADYADAMRTRARRHALADKPDAAQADLRRSESVERSAPGIARLALQAALSYRLGDTETGDRAASAARAIDGPAADFALMTEAARLRLPRPLRQQFEAEWRTHRSNGLPGRSAIELAQLAIEHTCEPTYYGGKAHLAQARQCIEKAVPALESVADAERLCELLDGLAWTKLLQQSARQLAVRFPYEPAFPYFECRSYYDEPSPRGLGRALALLAKARELAAGDSAHADAWRRRIDALAREWRSFLQPFTRFIGNDDE